MRIKDYAIQALKEAGRPMKTDELALAMKALGWDDTTFSVPPSHIVYTNLHGILQRQGENAPFRFMGKRVFGLSSQVATDEAQAVKVKDQVVPVATPKHHQYCGNCMHCIYTASEELYQRFGLCEMERVSKKHNVHQTDEGCEEWKRKALRHEERERLRQKELRITAIGFNMASKKARRLG